MTAVAGRVADWPNVWPPPAGGSLTVERASVELRLAVLDGPSGLPTPPLPPATGEDAHAPSTDEPQPPVVWRFEDDIIGRETRAVTASGSSYRGPFEAHIEEHYEGSVGVSTDDPAHAWARGPASYRIAWPKRTCRRTHSSSIRSDADAYYVAVDVVAQEGLGADCRCGHLSA